MASASIKVETELPEILGTRDGTSVLIRAISVSKLHVLGSIRAVYEVRRCKSTTGLYVFATR